MFITNNTEESYLNTVRSHNDHLILYGLTEENIHRVITILPDNFFANPYNYIFIGYNDSKQLFTEYLHPRGYQGKIYNLASDISLEFLEYQKATYQLSSCIMHLILKINTQEMAQANQEMLVLKRYLQDIIAEQKNQIETLQEKINTLTRPMTIPENTLSSNPYTLHAAPQHNSTTTDTQPKPGSLAYILNK